MKLTEERKAEVLALCKKLVSNRSYSGEENAVADVLKCFMRQKQFDDFCTDKYGNVIGKTKATGLETRFCLTGIWILFRQITKKPGNMIPLYR